MLHLDLITFILISVTNESPKILFDVTSQLRMSFFSKFKRKLLSNVRKGDQRCHGTQWDFCATRLPIVLFQLVFIRNLQILRVQSIASDLIFKRIFVNF